MSVLPLVLNAVPLYRGCGPILIVIPFERVCICSTVEQGGLLSVYSRCQVRSQGTLLTDPSDTLSDTCFGCLQGSVQPDAGGPQADAVEVWACAFLCLLAARAGLHRHPTPIRRHVTYPLDPTGEGGQINHVSAMHQASDTHQMPI